MVLASSDCVRTYLKKKRSVVDMKRWGESKHRKRQPSKTVWTRFGIVISCTRLLREPGFGRCRRRFIRHRFQLQENSEVFRSLQTGLQQRKSQFEELWHICTPDHIGGVLTRSHQVWASFPWIVGVTPVALLRESYAAPIPPPPIETRQQEGPIQRNRDFLLGFCGSVGFNSVRLVDTHCCGGCDLPGTLDHAKDSFAASFQSGKV